MSPLSSGVSGKFGFHCRAAGALLCLAFIVSGCGAFSSAVSGTKAALGIGPRPVAPDWKTLLITAAGNANANSAVAVDLVLVKDVAMLESLLTMSAAKWFAMRSDLQRTFPEALSVYPYELVPTQLIRMEEKQFGRERVWAALVFARYASPGEHRARLLLNTAGYVVQLNAQSFNASEVKTGAAQ
jgi:type VI secretion system protein